MAEQPKPYIAQQETQKRVRDYENAPASAGPSNPASGRSGPALKKEGGSMSRRSPGPRLKRNSTLHKALRERFKRIVAETFRGWPRDCFTAVEPEWDRGFVPSRITIRLHDRPLWPCFHAPVPLVWDVHCSEASPRSRTSVGPPSPTRPLHMRVVPPPPMASTPAFIRLSDTPTPLCSGWSADVALER